MCQQTYCNPGDEIIYPSPGFPIYESFIRYVGAVPVPLHLREELGFSVTGADLEKLITPRTKLIAVTHMSNVLGTVNPVAEMTRAAHDAGALVVVDGAQAVPHMRVDVLETGADFYAFSGHKMYGPTGIGVLHGKLDLLGAMPPYQGGGEMIRSVTFEKTEFSPEDVAKIRGRMAEIRRIETTTREEEFRLARAFELRKVVFQSVGLIFAQKAETGRNGTQPRQRIVLPQQESKLGS